MILTVDIGNTNIVISAYEAQQLIFTSRFATQASRTEDEYAILFMNVLRLYDCPDACIEGSIVSSVVPPLTQMIKSVLQRLFSCRVLVVSPGMKTGLNIRMENPAVVGADLVCAAVAARKHYAMPCIIFDLGTATTISALDAQGAFLGGSILPGVRVSLQALSSSTAQLLDVDILDYNGAVIGGNTVDAMQSGAILGCASMMDGMILRYREQIGEDATVVVTGGMASFVLPYCKTPNIVLDQDLLSNGLYLLYQMNTKSNH